MNSKQRRVRRRAVERWWRATQARIRERGGMVIELRITIPAAEVEEFKRLWAEMVAHAAANGEMNYVRVL